MIKTKWRFWKTLSWKRRKDGNPHYVQIPTYLMLLAFITVTGYAGGSIYWIIKKDNEVEKYRRMEIELQNQIKERDLYLQQNRQTIEQLEKRFEILDAVRQMSSADVSEVDKVTIARILDKESRKFGHDPYLLLALMSTESSLRPWVTSHKGAHGLMQIMPQTGKALIERVENEPRLIGFRNDEKVKLPKLRDIEGNIQLGTLYFTKLLLKYRDLKKAIYAYNLGPNLLEKRLQEGGRLPEKYCQKVISTYRRIVNDQEKKDIPFKTLVASYPQSILLAQADSSSTLP